MIAAATTTRVNHLFSAGTAYHGASGVAVRRIMNFQFERESLSSQFAPHARQMPAILVIAKEAAEMQPDAIEATQLDRNSGVARGLEFVVDCHILFHS
jgi:hypothetical protein